MTLEERVSRLEAQASSVITLRQEVQQFRLEALKANADLASGIARDIHRLEESLRRLESGQQEILSRLRRPRWPWER